MTERTVYIYTDGACSGNPGPGGWGAVLMTNENGENQKELSGGDKHTTNNRMEMTAVIEGLKALKRPCNVIVTTDSKYVCDAIDKGWARKWKANNYIKSDKKPALNSDLWDQMLSLLDTHKVQFKWVKGHAGHKYNELCDKLAVDYYKNNFL